ncbi:ATP-binding protein [Pedobacter sp. UYP1]|jgi:signal transduction histidine kinase|uniref:ATP-binding protein n=1 Tax=Pedobacter sp. UYP1 TaxID=1756396 RepID=UPI003395378E
MEYLKGISEESTHTGQPTRRELLEEIAILQSVLESTSASIFAFDKNFNYIAFNKSHQQTVRTGRGIDLKIGDNYLEIARMNGGTDGDKTQKIFKRVMAGETIEVIEEFGDLALHRASFSMICNPMYDHEGQVNGMTVFCQDVSERVALEKEVEEKSHLLNGVLDNLPVITYEVDAEGIFTKSVGSGLQAVGLQNDELVGKNAFESFPAAAVELQKALAGKSGQFVSKLDWDGQEYVYQNNVFPSPDQQGSITGFALNITQQHQAEIALLKAKEKAEQAMLAKQQFLTNMSHEIRTPMNAVIGMTHLLLQEDPKPDQLENLNILKFSSESLLSLINDILDYSKIELGKVTLEKIDFNLIELINSIKQAHNLHAEGKEVFFNINIDPKLPEILIGDPVRLTQILNNLISNALKFTNEGYVIVDLSMKKIVDDLVDVSFTITDTGIGIEPALKDYIFESFTQASADISRRFGGTGLGLAITKRLIELKGGKIYVDSTLGKGSSFFFDLQFKKSNKKSGYTMPALVFESLAGFKVLLVEDNEINTIVAGKFMKKWDLDIDYAIHGIEALEKVKKNEYDVVLMDLQMPKMDGYEASTAIRNLSGKRFKELPIIALTASVLAEINNQVMDAGMNDYISKPFNPMELYSKIAKYVRKR